jgi:hypothetical protein
MSEDRGKQDKNLAKGICPYLGLKDDRATVSAYPSHWNVCYHVSPSSTPKFDHQRSYCLTNDYHECDVYHQPADEKMPKEIQYSEPAWFMRIKSTKLLLIIIPLFVILILAMVLWGSRQRKAQLEGNPDPVTSLQATLPDGYQTATSESVLDEQIPLAEATETVSSLLTITPSPNLPTPTPTSTIPPLALETPIGLTYRFIIHRAVEGESLLLFANWYDTSAEAIQAVNLNLTYPIQVGELVIIPVAMTDVTGLPAFEPYEVQQDVLVEDLAIELGVTAEDLRLFNNLEEGITLSAGHWVIVPRERVAP